MQVPERRPWPAVWLFGTEGCEVRSRRGRKRCRQARERERGREGWRDERRVEVSVYSCWWVSLPPALFCLIPTPSLRRALQQNTSCHFTADMAHTHTCITSGPAIIFVRSWGVLRCTKKSDGRVVVMVFKAVLGNTETWSCTRFPSQNMWYKGRVCEHCRVLKKHPHTTLPHYHHHHRHH